MTVAAGKLSLDQVPSPPSDAAPFYGDPPYDHHGYVVDADRPEGPCRWRYRGQQLIGFMIYHAERNGWRSAWFEGRGY